MTIRLPKYDEPYTNCIQLTGLFLRLEFMIAMATIKVYHNETDTWSPRRAVWYCLLGIPALYSLAIMVCAATKYVMR